MTNWKIDDKWAKANKFGYEGCYSEDFLHPGESIITLHRILESYGVKFDDLQQGQSTRNLVLSVVEFLNDVLKLDTLEYFSLMLPLDAILLNEDRHLNNIAFIHSPKGYRLCPLFDHGLSLLSDTCHLAVIFQNKHVRWKQAFNLIVLRLHNS